MQTIRAVSNLSLNDMKGEVWKDIIGYEKNYKISNYGRIKSLRRLYEKTVWVKYRDECIKKLLIQNISVFVTLSKNAINTNFRIKDLVASHFLENPDNKTEVIHINGDYLNNRFDNLKYI